MRCRPWRYALSVTEQISKRDLRYDMGRIMRGLDEGRTYVVTRRSEPIGELRPMRLRRFADARTVTEIFRGAPVIDRDRFRNDLDAIIDQAADPRA